MMNFKKIICFVLGGLFPLLVWAQEEVLTNKSILDMLELGFTSDVVVGKIQTTKSFFNTTVEALKDLKEKGVDNAIIIAMMHSQKTEKEKANENKSEKTGIYVKDGDEYKKIYPTVFSGTKTNTLGAALTYGLADAQIKSTLNGEHSQNVIDDNSPEFYFYFDNTQTSELSIRATNWWFAVASSPNEFVLVKLNSKGKKREMEIGKVNLYAGNSVGVNEKNIIKFNITTLNDTEFKVIPERLLEPGEYCFYYQGIVPVGGYTNQAVFDFSIPNKSDSFIVSSCLTTNKGKFVWVMRENKPRRYIIVDCKKREDGIYYGLSLNDNSFAADFFVKESECYRSKKELKNMLGFE